MYVKRVILFGLVLLAVFFPLNALTINEILTAANNVSYAMRNAEITYQNNLLSLEENSLDDEAQWNVAVELLYKSVSVCGTYLRFQLFR